MKRVNLEERSRTQSVTYGAVCFCWLGVYVVYWLDPDLRQFKEGDAARSMKDTRRDP